MNEKHSENHDITKANSSLPLSKLKLEVGQKRSNEDGVVWVEVGDIKLSSRFMKILDRKDDLLQEIAGTAKADKKLLPEFPLTVWKETRELVDGCTRALGALSIDPKTPVPVVYKSFKSYSEARAYSIWTVRKRREIDNAITIVYVAQHSQDVDPLQRERVLKLAHPRDQKFDVMEKVHECTSQDDYDYWLSRKEMSEEIGVSVRKIAYILTILREADDMQLSKVLMNQTSIKSLGERLEKKTTEKSISIPQFLSRVLSSEAKASFLKMANAERIEPKELIVRIVVDTLRKENLSIDDVVSGKTREDHATIPASAQVQPTMQLKRKTGTKKTSIAPSLVAKAAPKEPRKVISKNAWTTDKNIIVVESRLRGEDLDITASLLGCDQKGRPISAKRLKSQLFHLGIRQTTTMKESERKILEALLLRLKGGQ